jgi:hypothetical protein
VPLVIDASGWGQNVDVIFNTWEEIQAHDPLHNVLFSVHSYWGDINNYNRVAKAAINDGLPIIIGEGPSPTAYPNCTILDYQTGLDICGRNEIGWISWSWGGLANGHCIPNFDHTLDGVFGDWRTTYAADMMVDHPFSLMRTSEKPESFFPDGPVSVSGIYLDPVVSEMFIGDTIQVDVIVTPSNAAQMGSAIVIEGEKEAVSYDPLTHKLAALAEGIVTITAVSEENDQVSFSREIQVNNIPVNSIRINPSESEMMVGDTLFFHVELLPENATVREYSLEVLDNSGAIQVDSSGGRIIALEEGSAWVVVKSSQEEFTDTLSISVWNQTFTGNGVAAPTIRIYPNPNEGLLYIVCDQQFAFDMKILDLGGKVVLEEAYTGTARINTNQLSSGTYLVVHAGNDMIIRQKLIIL